MGYGMSKFKNKRFRVVEIEWLKGNNVRNRKSTCNGSWPRGNMLTSRSKFRRFKPD